MAHERCLVLAHVVSAGKTATMTMGMMAMRNTGQITKPMVTVPNYLVEQWEDTVRKLFPTARILALTSDDLADGKRDRVLEYIRSNDFDLIITSHSLFDSIPLSPEFHELYRNDEARLLREQIAHERRRDGKSVSLKQLEERSTQFTEELKARAAAVRTPRTGLPRRPRHRLLRGRRVPRVQEPGRPIQDPRRPREGLRQVPACARGP
ncbi:hypothetical protein GCM10020254_87740 [Streptomyces goshikiensis]